MSPLVDRRGFLVISSKLSILGRHVAMKIKHRFCAWLQSTQQQASLFTSLWGHPEPGFCSITGTATSESLSFAFLFLSALFSLFPWIPFRCLFYVSLFSFGRVRVCICSINKCNVLCPRVCVCVGWSGVGASARVGRAQGLSGRQAGRQGLC